tara:strand:+ start:1161 stop:2078 length:918 start_codon:yes stop_codon:yes gene_type:complete
LIFNLIAIFRSPGPIIFNIGPISLRWYGLLIATSVLIGLSISNELGKRRGLAKDVFNELLPILVVSSIIGARAYYVTFEWSNYSGINFWESIKILKLNLTIPSFFAIWRGGIAIHGALIMGFISVFIYSKIKQYNLWDIVDTILPSVALGQALGRWGNFFNNEAFGLPTELPWKLYIPLHNRPVMFASQDFFHPTFLYESLWNFVTFIILITLFSKTLNRRINLPSGSITCIYLISYGLGRLWIESLRIDPLCLGGLPPFCEGGLRIAQLVSFTLISFGGFGIYWIYWLKKKLPLSTSTIITKEK